MITGAEAALSHAMREWEIRPSDVRLHERLAVGGFAEVFRGTWNGTTVAVKQLLERGPDVVRRMREEAATLARLRHPNLLLFMGWCADPPLIATEFMRRGSLHNILRRHGGPFNAPRTHHAATSVARGMQYLHSRSPPILHLDLKSPNILVDDKWRVKIADFGLARARQSTLLSGRSNFHGTPEWMAPEMLRAESHDEKADVYSFGVVLWELLAAQTPWNDLHPMQVVAVVGYSDRRLTLPPAALAYAQENLVTRVIGDLFWECASKDPRQRPDFDRALARLERAPNALLPAAPPPLPGSSAGTDTPRSDAPSLGPSEHHPGATPRALRQPFGDGRAREPPRRRRRRRRRRRHRGAAGGAAAVSRARGGRRGTLRARGDGVDDRGDRGRARGGGGGGGGGGGAGGGKRRGGDARTRGLLLPGGNTSSSDARGGVGGRRTSRDGFSGDRCARA